MDFEEASKKALAFRDEREWSQFHNSKDLALSISLEGAELVEVFQWAGSDLERSDSIDRMREELVDVLIYAVYLAHRVGIDLAEAMSDKIDANAAKYPIDKARGTSREYTDL